MRFDYLIFFHAMYVGLVYGCLAFGALIYRQYHDDRLAHEQRLGEDLYTFPDPGAIGCILGLCGLFCIFALLALSRPQPSIQLYVVPVAIFINIVQMTLRVRWQPIQIQTRGIVIRHLLFRYGLKAIPYKSMSIVEVHDSLLWKKIFFYTVEETPAAQCRMPRKLFQEFVRILSSRSDCRIVYESVKTN